MHEDEELNKIDLVFVLILGCGVCFILSIIVSGIVCVYTGTEHNLIFARLWPILFGLFLIFISIVNNPRIKYVGIALILCAIFYPMIAMNVLLWPMFICAIVIGVGGAIASMS